VTFRDKLVVVAFIALLALTSAGAIVAEQGRPSLVAAIGGTYVEGEIGGYRHLMPYIAATPMDGDVVRLVFNGLMRTDRNGEIVPDLAAAYRVEQDGKVWTFEIRDDARWHDGRPVVADDVVYTVGLFQDRAYTGPFADAFRGVVVDRIAPKAVRFTLPGPYGPFAASTTFPVLPAHRLGGVPFLKLPAEPFALRPVGTGPFKVVETTERDVTLAANTEFYRTKPARTRPYLDRFVLRSYSDGADALTALARGDLDGVSGISSEDAERARAIRSVAIYSYPTNDFTALFLNVRPERPALSERVVRQAIATAIDRGRVLAVAIDGRGIVADSFVPRTSWAHPTELRRYERSVPDAQAMLDAAGWKDTDGDGVRDKGGVELSISLQTSDEPARVNAADQIAHDLRLIGIEARIETMPFDRLVDTVARPRAFDALLVGITAALEPDPYTFFHSSQATDPGFNFSGFSTLPLDRSLEAARRAGDRDRRKALYEPVLQAIATEVPVVFLYFSDVLYAQHVAVKGLKVAHITEPSQRFWDVEDWYVRSIARR
jgi:peptide/nickel transport system substrate-binding protein